MNKILNPKFVPLVATSAGLFGFMLRLLTLKGGTDSEGLYTFEPLPWVLLWIVTAAVPVLVLIMARPLKETGKFSENFPPSMVSAVGSLIGALGLALTGWAMFRDALDTLALVTGLMGLAAAASLVAVAFARMKGQKPNFLYHAAVCLYLALRIFNQCKLWSNEPQISIFLFPFLAQIIVMLAAYQLCTFDVDLGKRPVSLMWSLWGVYLCLVALPGLNASSNLLELLEQPDTLFFGTMAIWLLTNLCSLRPVKKRKAPAQEPQKPVQAQMSSKDVSIDEIKTWLDEE